MIINYYLIYNLIVVFVQLICRSYRGSYIRISCQIWQKIPKKNGDVIIHVSIIFLSLSTFYLLYRYATAASISSHIRRLKSSTSRGVGRAPSFFIRLRAANLDMILSEQITFAMYAFSSLSIRRTSGYQFESWYQLFSIHP